ncbi:hypothetical protein QN397_23655 [Variovorax sp. RTB1]|uniref:hypothetical protein n=1 Tax=Variovorax sp. RTB1 TaxID=3048631 RepID=UPI002B22377C|nr:hypothetical protein [Variovorax sp. RTB1]MEB0114280.1 hypothetical protein [Variovorax sp. RTB1]
MKFKHRARISTMTTTTNNAREAAPAPAGAWIKFLRSYGPTPENGILFDEHVSKALAKANVAPISLPTTRLAAIAERAANGLPGSILIAGTAGDGKTFHCRSLWLSLGGDGGAWAAKSMVKELQLANGRTAIFVKDLSELAQEDSDYAMNLLEQSALGAEDKRFLVIAANHGQILERLRDFGNRRGRQSDLRNIIQDSFLLASTPPARLAIYDLSASANRDTLNNVFDAVANHPEWDKCGGCGHQGEGKVCPIYENRNRMLGAADGGLLSTRLGDVAEVAKFNGWHLPIRDMLTLASNMILGHPAAKEGLMTCADVPRIQEEQDVERASLYSNIFGSNLKPKMRQRLIFQALASFGIGSETTNGVDGLLVYGADDPALAPAFDRLLRADPVYGANDAYLSELRRYLEGEEEARLDSGAAEFLARLEAQRRRLFFTVSDGEQDYAHWPMSVFRFANEYLALAADVSNQRPISEPIRSRLAKGLNRVMTGLLIENGDKLFVASSGGFTQSRVSVLCDTEAPARRVGGVGMRARVEPLSGRPLLEVALAAGETSPASLALTPVRFEFLCRVADGALPGSFSNECLEDLLAFKARLLRKAELLRRQRAEDDDDDAANEQTLTLNFIDMEQSGMGFSRPVTIRTVA